ncbi:DUF397 domain-containing protein [Streptomyces tagetis]|uniref:DUF397 domain-containing protein n=1 Tax=Streptomyces tagetis TaxID=2820809 RepID=A0A940XRY6_9ACTN|nr:DUF397 domain-containing protein [Streptomyces sp. RG38]MBQ0830075.1 DUF397 domain-containing protein [Streptomyces sp. RG38]
MSHRPASPEAAALVWLKSSYSDTSNPSDCVEVAMTATSVHLRDSKRHDGPHLAVTRTAWAEFVAAGDGTEAGA